MANPEDDRKEPNGGTTLSAQQARQGKELNAMRYVLSVSLALAVVAGVVIYTVFR